jgi:hypothetical protein
VTEFYRSSSFTAFRKARRERLEDKKVVVDLLDRDPDVQRCREERAKRPLGARLELAAAKAEFEAQLAAQRVGKKGRGGRPRGRSISIPTSERARILNAIDDAALAKRAYPGR